MANRYTTTRHFQGAGELSAALRKLGDGALEVLEAGVRAALDPIEEAMIRLAPIRPNEPRSRRKLRRGEMKESIRRKIVPYQATRTVVGLVGPSGRAGRVAHLVEYGHIMTSSVKGKTIRKGTAEAAKNGTQVVSPRPFIRPAVYSTLGAQGARFAAGANAKFVAVATAASAAH